MRKGLSHILAINHLGCHAIVLTKRPTAKHNDIIMQINMAFLLPETTYYLLTLKFLSLIIFKFNYKLNR